MYEYASSATPVAAVSTPNEAQEIAASYKPQVAGCFRLWRAGSMASTSWSRWSRRPAQIAAPNAPPAPARNRRACGSEGAFP